MMAYPRSLYWVLALWTLSLGGCASWQATGVDACAEQEDEIRRLRQSLAEMDAEIRRLRAHEQARGKELEETTVQAARAEVKLRRFTTEADAASRLAEVEVAMESLRSMPGVEGGPLQTLAQQLLDKAAAAFKQGEHGETMNLSAQARQLIDMQLANVAPAAASASSETVFKVAIPLGIRVDTHLRARPGVRATSLGILPAATQVMAIGYQGLWLQVQGPERNTGWVSSELVEPR